MKAIELTQGYVAVIDDSDFDNISQFKWYFKGGYAVRSYRGTTIRMHRYIMATPKTLDTDHINGDRLDNRRQNLRVATRQQNAANQRASSGYKGVYKHCDKWKAMIKVNYRIKYLGLYPTPESAAMAYNAAASEAFGEFARLNCVR